MASLTRARADNPGLIPTRTMAEYYGQRASAGLIISEGTWVNVQSIGFIKVPGIYTQEQLEGWKMVTRAVHDRDGLIFLQLGHIGAASHPDLLNGKLPVGPSAVNVEAQAFTPDGFKDTVQPRSMTLDDIRQTVQDFKNASRNGKAAGFDGVEIHAQSGMLIPQFLSMATNKRTDLYGGSIENRSRIVFEIVDALMEVWGGGRVAIKFTPVMFNNVGIVKPDEDTIELFKYLMHKLNDYDLAYVHIVGPSQDLSATPVAVLQDHYFQHFRNNYRGRLMVNLGFSEETGNKILDEGTADLVSFGEPFIANPDLVERFQFNLPLSEGDRSTYYTGGPKGYTTYERAVLGAKGKRVQNPGY